jgi:hypothetical protein
LGCLRSYNGQTGINLAGDCGVILFERHYVFVTT